MLLAVDVGNTNIVIGCLVDGRIVCDGRIATDRQKTMEEYAIYLKVFLEMNHMDVDLIDGAVLSSVVPPVTNPIASAIQLLTDVYPLIVKPGIKTGLVIRTDQPEKLGSDLVVDAVAALEEYEAPLVIFDLGTATTCSVINANKEYLGGLILPGVRVSTDALSRISSQLPQISLESPGAVIGKNTIDCMRSGAVYGNAAMMDGILIRVKEELGSDVTAIATGGLAPVIAIHCKEKIHLDPDLLVKGLWYLYQKNR